MWGGTDENSKSTNEVQEVETPSFKVNEFPSMFKPRFVYYLATIKSDIVAIGKRVKLNKSLDESVRSVEFCSEKRKTWTQHYVQIDERI